MSHPLFYHCLLKSKSISVTLSSQLHTSNPSLFSHFHNEEFKYKIKNKFSSQDKKFIMNERNNVFCYF
jgi:hypothetical protein